MAMSTAKATRSWARIIENYEEIPETFKKYLKEYMEEHINYCIEFPYIVFAPPERGYPDKVNAKLICIIEDELLVLEKDKKKLCKTILKIKDINYIESGTILLNSWFRISGQIEGKISTVTLVFNTIAESIFKPILDRIREVCSIKESEADLVPDQEAREKFSFLSTLNFKFMSMARNSVTPGEIIERILFQPEIKEQYFKLFGRTFYKTLVKSSLTILINKELILISDPEYTFVKSGGIRHFISLKKLRDVSVVTSNDQVVSSIILEFCGEKLQINLSYSKIDEIRELIRALQLSK